MIGRIPNASRYVQSATDLGDAGRPRRGIVVHGAEGGGTVNWLAGGNDPNRVSVHGVYEYSGDLVQMLDLSRMHTSIRVTALRTTDDAPFTFGGLTIRYGVTAAKAVMAEQWSSPNRGSYAFEYEGFAAAGPNAAQVESMRETFAWLRANDPDLRGMIGHRCYADYKACPGQKVPWHLIGGYGVWGATAPEEVRVNAFPIPPTTWRLWVKPGARLFPDDSLTGTAAMVLDEGRYLDYGGAYGKARIVRYVPPAGGAATPWDRRGLFVDPGVTGTPEPKPAPAAPAPVDTTALVQEVKTKAKEAAVAAIEEVTV